MTNVKRSVKQFYPSLSNSKLCQCIQFTQTVKACSNFLDTHFKWPNIPLGAQTVNDVGLRMLV